MTHAFTLLAQASPAAAPSAWLQFVPMVLILVVFYFLLVAPMRKRQRELASMIDKLQKGDKVVFGGGIHGEIAAIEGAIVHVKVADQMRLKVQKSAITQVEDRGTKE
jgi:preprotein translocase subunit YajC